MFRLCLLSSRRRWRWALSSTRSASAFIRATRNRTSRPRSAWTAPRIATWRFIARVPIEQLRLQPDRATGDGRHRRDKLPRWVVVSSSEHGVLAKHERENVLDHNWTTSADLRGTDVWVDIDSSAAALRRSGPGGRGRFGAIVGHQEWSLILSGSEDGKTWRSCGAMPEGCEPPRVQAVDCAAGAGPQPVFTRGTALRPPAALARRRGRIFRGGRRLDLGGPYDFSSAWMSAGSGEEWVYVDLGAQCTFDRVKLDWIRRAAEGSVEASDDAVHWRTLAPLPNAAGAIDEIRLPEPAQARYVRLRMTKPASPEGYILSEMEVWGRGGPLPVAHPAAATETGGRVNLAGAVGGGTRIAGQGGWRGDFTARIFGPRLADCNGSGHGAYQLPERGRGSRSELR